MSPTRPPFSWSVSATRPAHCPEPELVPLKRKMRTCPSPDELHKTSTPPSLPALYDTSGTPRECAFCTGAWKGGRLYRMLKPPPPAAPKVSDSFQAVSDSYAPVTPSANSLVPPTAVMFG